jgi:hypothetical protein
MVHKRIEFLMMGTALAGASCSNDFTHEFKDLAGLLHILRLHNGFMSHEEVKVGLMLSFTPMAYHLVGISNQPLFVLSFCDAMTHARLLE